MSLTSAKTPSQIGDLPQPDEVALYHSARLLEHLCAMSREGGGPLPFWRFMEAALYAPGLGYYVAGSHKFGAAGDFVTAPEISPLFSRCLARQCAPILEALGGGDVLEFGAGSGAMAMGVLRELRALDALPERYLIVEVSPDLAARQRAALEAELPDLRERVVWLECLPERFRGVVLANEVLDAMPVHRFRLTSAGIRELGVACQEDRLVEAPMEPSARLRQRVEMIVAAHGLKPPYDSEVNFAMEDWLTALSQMLTVGAALLIDYGFPAREFYHPQRAAGTLMCHYRHRAHSDPLILPGLQDITAHVDFSAVAEAAHGAGLHVGGYTTQANFLLGAGLVEMLGPVDNTRAHLEMTAQVKRLTLPTEMGELFKVMALTRGIEIPLKGFMVRDERGRL